jgi:hypothetical protein
MLNRIVTGDESWMHHYQPESKRASVQWKHPISPSRSTKKFKVNAIGWVHYAYRVLGYPGSTVIPFSEAW